MNKDSSPTAKPELILFYSFGSISDSYTCRLVSASKIIPHEVVSVMSDSKEYHVAFYIPSFERGGVERLVINLSRELVSQGHNVDLLVRETDPPIQQLEDAVSVVRLESLDSIDGLVHRALTPHVSNAVLSLPSYVGYLRKCCPDLLVSMQTSPFAVLGAILAHTETAVAVRESNTPSAATSNSAHVVGRLAPLAKRLTYPRADHVLAVSRDAADDIAEYIGMPHDEITVIYNPTYNDTIVDSARESVEHPWFDDDVPIVTSVGRFSDQKDFETLLRAFAHVRKLREVRLVLVGDGTNRDRLETLATALGIKGNVAFVGYQKNPYKFMAGADLFVLSSYYEGLPNVLIEALGVGTPAIATDCPSGPREILLDGDGGDLVPVGDVDAMANAIKLYLDNPTYARNRLDTARGELDRFTPKRAAQKYLHLADTDSSP